MEVKAKMTTVDNKEAVNNKEDMVVATKAEATVVNNKEVDTEVNSKVENTASKEAVTATNVTIHLEVTKSHSEAEMLLKEVDMEQVVAMEVEMMTCRVQFIMQLNMLEILGMRECSRMCWVC